MAEFVDKYICDQWEKLAQEAEAKGRLRRLVPPEAIGRDRYWWQQKRPPRLKPLKD